jgi:hypothetical protein
MRRERQRRGKQWRKITGNKTDREKKQESDKQTKPRDKLKDSVNVRSERQQARETMTQNKNTANKTGRDGK